MHQCMGASVRPKLLLGDQLISLIVHVKIFHGIHTDNVSYYVGSSDVNCNPSVHDLGDLSSKSCKNCNIALIKTHNQPNPFSIKEIHLTSLKNCDAVSSITRHIGYKCPFSLTHNQVYLSSFLAVFDF